MQHEVKSFRAEFKARNEGDKGIVTAVVSVFNNVDLGGDRVLPGAFKNTIADWQTKGDPVPVIWSHEWDQPESHIGFVDPQDLKETAVGLEVKMQFDLDRPRAEQVFHLLKNRRVTQFSFGYFAKSYEDVEDEELGKVRELKEIELFEVGPTLLGMNPETILLEAASAIRGRKEGRVLNSKNEEALATARDLIDSVLKSATPADERPSTVTGKTLTKATSQEVAEGVFASFNYEGPAVGRIEHVMTEGVFGIEGSEYSIEGTPDDPAVLLRIFDDEDEGFVETEILIGRRASEITVIEPVQTASKSISAEIKAISVPDYVRSNARRGLDYLAEGYGGDGLRPETIADARRMANDGTVSEDKVKRIGPWIARHIGDLDAEKNSNPDNPQYPGPGLVAMLLWGAGPDKDGARRAQSWAERESAKLDEGKNAPEATVEIQEVPVTEEVSGDAQGTINSMDERINELLIETR